jgi:hypothetical protein
MRYYTETTKEDFLAKVKKLMEGEEFPWEMSDSIEKDLSKVNFDWENYTSFSETEGFGYPVGYKELAPNFHIYLCAAGGDWEVPVCYIFYNSEEGLRAFIPKEGNVWNKEQKCAYGSERIHNEETEDEDKLWKDNYSEEELYKGIINRIIKK